MRSRSIVVVIAAATLGAVSLPALSKDGGVEVTPADQTRQRAPHARLDERANSPAQVHPRTADRRDQGPAEPHRPPRRDDARPETRHRDYPHPHADGRDGDHRRANHRHGDHRHADRRQWVDPIPDHRHFNYVLPRPSYYGAPRVHYTPPIAYYGAAPRLYYPHATPALVLQAGDYLPPEFRNQQFVVTDWEWRGLPEPAYGYQWMLLGPDNFALVAQSTGQIVSLVAIR